MTSQHEHGDRLRHHVFQCMHVATWARPVLALGNNALHVHPLHGHRESAHARSFQREWCGSSSRPAIWYSQYLVFARIPNTKYHIFMYSQVFGPLKRPFLASWGAWLDLESILENLNRRLSQKKVN